MLSQFSSFGFVGRRSGVGVAAAAAVVQALPPSAAVFATCGRGVPAVAAAVPGAFVFQASSPPWSALPPRRRFAARAAAFVRGLAAAPAPLLLAWPGCPLPWHLSWSRRSWQSCGSGSWSEVALAVGLGAPVVVFGVGQLSPAARPVVVAGFSGWLLELAAAAAHQVGLF